MVSLWDLLTALCFAMPIAGALASAKPARVGFNSYVLAITIGVVLGLGCAYIMRTAGKAVASRSKGHSVSVRERYFRALYLAAIVWIVLGLFLGSWASSNLLRLVI
jgi:hypothetical protein